MKHFLRRRLLIALLLVISIAGGLWWNSTRLNETERKLVGVWQATLLAEQKYAIILLADRKSLSAENINGKWMYSPELPQRWWATPRSLTFRWPVPATTDFSIWQVYLEVWWNNKRDQKLEIVRLTDDTVEYAGDDRVVSLHRSTDPELRRIFESLNAGESP